MSATITYTALQVERFRSIGDETPNGVAYDWGLAGPGGAWYTLIRESHHTLKDINEARRHLRRSQDVVRLDVARLEGPPVQKKEQPPLTGEERIAAVRTIHQEHQCARVEGVLVDAYSASAIVAVYDSLSEANKVKYREMDVALMAGIAFKLLK